MALDFSWEKGFFPIELEFVKARFERYWNKKDQKCFDHSQTNMFPDLPQDLSAKPNKSSKGRKRIDFYALLNAFLLAPLLYVVVMVTSVHFQVMGNSDFRTVCGFKSIPSLKTFDQIMIENALWEKARQLMVKYIQQGVIGKEEQIADDATHVEAEATLHATRKCGHSEPCDCSKIPTDDNVGLMRKSNTVTYIAHKIALVCGVKSELPLSRSVFRGGHHDGTTLTPTLEKVKQDLPEEWVETFQYVSADGIYQNKGNQEQTKEILQAKLLSPIISRKIKDQPLDARGVTKLDKYGVPHCISGHRLKLKGLDETKNNMLGHAQYLIPNISKKGFLVRSRAIFNVVMELKRVEPFAFHKLWLNKLILNFRSIFNRFKPNMQKDRH